MKFWTLLRWISTAALAALLIWTWLYADDVATKGGAPAHAARQITF